MNVLTDTILTKGENFLVVKSLKSLCPFATKLAFSLSTIPLDLCLTLNTHLDHITFMSIGLDTVTQGPYFI